LYAKTPYKFIFFPYAGCTTILLTNESVICTSCTQSPLTNHHLEHENEAYKFMVDSLCMLFFFIFIKGIVQELIHKLKYKEHRKGIYWDIGMAKI
jgi:hypothetical protein